MTDPLITLGTLPLYGTSEAGVFWQVPRDGLKGWWGAPASTIAPTQRSRANGAWAGDAWLAARNLALTGVVDAPERTLALGAIESLSAAATLDETPLNVVEVGATVPGSVPAGSLTIVDNGDGTVTVSWPDVAGDTITIDATNTSLTAQVRRTDELIVEWISDRAFRFSLQFIATDPRKVGTVLTGSTGLPSSTGGLTFPMTLPTTISAVTDAGLVTLDSPGNTTGRVTLRIDGPITGPTVTHVNSGRSLVFASSISVPAGGWIDVDMDARTVLENGTASRSAWVTNRGWSGFEPGSNVWAFSATSGSGTLTVNAYPSWI
jgi:hypothetical protein